VNAHQDDKKPYAELNIWSCLNCNADNQNGREMLETHGLWQCEALNEGFLTDSMEVEIKVIGVNVMLHIATLTPPDLNTYPRVQAL
jgi:predicted metal-binding protein